MLAETSNFLPQMINLDLGPIISSQELSRIKSTINSIVEDANLHQYRLIFPNLDEIIHTYATDSCNHHMMSCQRRDNVIFELAFYCKAAETSTSKNAIIQYVDLGL